MNHLLLQHISSGLKKAVRKWLLVLFFLISSILLLRGQPLPPQFKIEFSPQVIQPGQTSTLTYTLTNPNATIDFTALGFVDALPEGIVIAGDPMISNNCSGASVGASAGSDMITLIDAALNRNTICSISVVVTASEPGIYQNNAELSTGRDPVTSNTAVLAVGLDLEITLEDSVVYDPSGDQIANPGDTIGYKLTIENQGQSSAFDLTIENGSDPNTTLDPATIRATPVAINDEYQLTTLSLNIPSSIGVLANDADINDPLPNPPYNDNLTVLSVQDGSLGIPQPTENGGTVIMEADGGFVYDSTGVFTAIKDSFYYKIIDSEGFVDSAKVVVFWTRPPVAQNDFFDVLVNVANVFPSDTLFADNGNGADDIGIPAGFISSFGGGDLGGTVETHPAGSTVNMAGGILSVQADGSFTLSNPTTTGIYTFSYRIKNIIGFSDATVTISVNEGPVAQDDQYEFLYTADQTVDAAGGLFADNGSGGDNLAFPAADLTSFGGGDLGGSVTDHVAGSAISLAGGNLTVYPDGSWALTGQPFTPGIYTFDYQIGNVAGTSTATVTLVIQDPPLAQKDSLSVNINEITSLAVGTLFNDNGYGADHPGTPSATVASFGGGTLGGDETSYVQGSTQAFAGGNITVNADGSLTMDNPTMEGNYTFSYRLVNTSGFSNAEVVISILSIPMAQDDQFEFLYTADQTLDAAGGLFADNGSGGDNRAFPAADLTSFGGGDVGGSVTDHVAGSAVSLAGGNLTVYPDGSWALTGQPFTPGIYTFDYQIGNVAGTSTATVTLVIQDPPLAQKDSLSVNINEITSLAAGTLFNDNGFGADHRGTPSATVASFGGGTLGGDETSYVQGSTQAFAGGNITVNADGSLTMDNPTMEGNYTFSYRLVNTSGFSNAEVVISILSIPMAQDDEYEFLYTTDQNINSASGLFAENGSGSDNLAFPAATLTSFGGGDLGGSVTDHVAGSSVSLAGGNLTVHPDGSWALTGQPFTPGIYTFDYQIGNIAGTSTATVTLVIQDPPIAQKDSLSMNINEMTTLAAGTLFNDNGFGADHRGTPSASVASFGGGTLGGDETSYVQGSTQAFAGGNITVNADGSLTVDNPTMEGNYTFSYRLVNTSGFSNAEVVISILSIPVAQDDQYEFLYTADQTVDVAGGLFADNGSGGDDRAFPAADLTSFGGGDLGGSVTDHVAGSTVSLAGGNLTVYPDGSWALTGQPFTPGIYTFDYQIGNVAGTSTATATLVIQDPPIAQGDLLIAQVNMTTSYTAGTLFAENGFGADYPGYPVSAIASFGGGNIIGSTDVTDFVMGSTTGAGSFAGGTLTVNQDGSLVISNPTIAGAFTFMYRLENVAGHSDAVVTIDIQGPPNGQNDSSPSVLDSTSYPGDNNFHIAENGSTLGIINVFDDNGFGPDDLGNPSALNDLNPDVIQNIKLAGMTDAATGEIGGGPITFGTTGSLEITATGALNFTPPMNFVGIISFEYILANSVGADVTPDTVTLAVGERPTAIADNYEAVGNIPIESSQVAGSGVLANDEGDNIAVIAVEGNAMNVGVPVMTTAGGSLRMGSDGEFEYIPLTGFIGEDSFTYTIDNGFGAPSTATVTITIAEIIYFMDDQATAGGDGSLNSPFKTIAEHNAAMMPDSSFLFIKDNGFSYSGNLTLNYGETVIGEGSTGSLFGMTSLTNIVLPPLSLTVGYSTTGLMTDWVHITSASHGITLNQNNTLTGLNIGNTAGYGIIDSGRSVGNLMISEAIITGTGGGLHINYGGEINITLNAINATGNYFGILLRKVTGPGLNIPGNVTINNSGGSTDMIHLEEVYTTMVNIGTNTGSSVTLNNHTGHDAIEILYSEAPIQFGSTTITNSTTGNGVNFHHNTGNLSFINGNLNITTSSGTGIKATTNTGNLTITGSGNKLTTSSGSALHMVNSLIGGSHLNFESITASSGSAPAIVLDNTGSAGGLNVTGDNMNTSFGGNNSGGTIGGRTGSDGSTTSGIGIYLNNASHVHLKRMQLSGTFQNFGLRGSNVSNFSMEYCTFTGTFGTNAGFDEGVVSFAGLTGTALVRSSSLTGGLEDIIRIQNNSGNLDSLVIENSFIGLNSTSLGNDGILVQTLSNAIVKMRVSGTDFAGARGDCIQVNALGNSNVGVKIQNCDFTNAHTNIVTAGGGITLSGGDNMSNITYNYIVDNCTFSGSEGFSITAKFLSNQGIITGRISNNTITNTISGLVAGGLKNGEGGGNLIHQVLISNNNITGVYGGVGIQVEASGGASTFSRAETYATVANNSVTGMTGNGFTAMRLLVGGFAMGGDFAFVCADVRNNTLSAAGPQFASNAIIVDQVSSDARFNFPGYAGSANGEFGCVPGTASSNLSTYMNGRGNILTNGPFPSFAGGGVDGTLVCGATGIGINCE